MSNKYPTFLDEEVLTATPLRFVQLLYRGALDSVASARRYLRLGDIRARSCAINKAMAIVTELSLALNHQAGGELSKNLALLYGYVELLLMKANAQQVDPPLAEAERLLGTLAEAWDACAPAAAAPPIHQQIDDPLESGTLTCAY
jgi:flagellar protein FliS